MKAFLGRWLILTFGLALIALAGFSLFAMTYAFGGYAGVGVLFFLAATAFLAAVSEVKL